MAKFIFITDTHFKKGNIDSRNDNYFESLLKKFEYVLKYAKKHKINKIIHGGDLFFNNNISDYVAGIIADKLIQYKMKLYMIMGNHDISGKEPSTYINGKLFLYEKYDWFHFINKPIEFKDCVLMGYDYTKEDEKRDEFDINYKTDKIKILVLHQMIYGKEKSLVINNKTYIKSYKDISTNADIVLCGHYHIGCKEVKTVNLLATKVHYVFPGSFARVASNEDNQFNPAFAVIKVNKRDIKIKLKQIPCEKGIFNKTDNSYHIDIDMVEEFSKKLKKLSFVTNEENNIKIVLDNIDDKDLPFEIDDKLKQIIIDSINKVKRENDE